MRDAATRLVNRNRTGRDVFVRGDPEPVVIKRISEFQATLYDLLNAYAGLRQRQSVNQMTIERRRVWSLGDARVILQRMIGDMQEWTALDHFLVRYLSDPEERSTAIASAFAASLEMVKEGSLEIRQELHFAPIYMRRGSQPFAADDNEEAAKND
jgi:segregation and condensation protein A